MRLRGDEDARPSVSKKRRAVDDGTYVSEYGSKDQEERNREIRKSPQCHSGQATSGEPRLCHSGTSSAPYAANTAFQDDYGSTHEQHHQNPPTDQRRLRVVKLSSDVLAHNAKVALIETHGDGTSIGRDRSYASRIRLPVMEVSKHHSNLFSMTDPISFEEQFYIADTGSTYGTFVLSSDERTSQPVTHLRTSSFHRLSRAKQSSPPFQIRHKDLIRIAKTTFEVHIHSWPFSCSECALDGQGDEIVTTPATEAETPSSTKERNTKKSESANAAHTSSYLSGGVRRSGDRRIDTEADRRREMRSLRDFYLNKNRPP
ncbi:unnamed protein product [Sympodiomycopsis kandeliae]